MGLFAWLKRLFGSQSTELDRVLDEVRREIDADMPAGPKTPKQTSPSTQIAPAPPPPSRQIPPAAPPPVLPPASDLDAADFLPIGREELLEKAQGQSAWSS